MKVQEHGFFLYINCSAFTFLFSDFKEVFEYQWRSYTSGFQVIETTEDEGIMTSFDSSSEKWMKSIDYSD
jgi:hypothetical protein